MHPYLPMKSKKGVRMRHDSESDRFVLCSEAIVLACRCGVRLVLLGREADWHSEGRTEFACECGGTLALAHNFDEETLLAEEALDDAEAPSVKELIRRLRTTDWP